MKAQFEVSEEVWGRVKVASMLACKSIGEMIEPVLDKAFPGGLRAGGTDGGAQRGGSIPHSKTVKTTLNVVSESKNPAPSPQGELKEGYGWCLACKVKQVKLPGMLCASCAKP